MDSPDWIKFQRLVEENGHGCIAFETTDGLELNVLDVSFLELENKIVVLLENDELN
jgi:hypothetical protein